MKKKIELNKIYCMDAIEFLKQLPDDSVDLVLTDPPYNISQEGKSLGRKNLSTKSHKRNSDVRLDFGEWDHFKNERDFFDFTEGWFRECVRVLKPKGWIYIFFDKMKTGYFDLILAPKYNVNSRTIFAWLKSNPVPSFRKVNWLSASEFIWVGTKGKSKIINFLNQKEMYNYLITPNKSTYGKTSHPTEKPLILLKKFIITSSLKRDIVLDPFMGSGTTAVASKELGRNFIGCDINPEYVKMANERLSQESLFKNKKTNLKDFKF